VHEGTSVVSAAATTDHERERERDRERDDERDEPLRLERLMERLRLRDPLRDGVRLREREPLQNRGRSGRAEEGRSRGSPSKTMRLDEHHRHSTHHQSSRKNQIYGSGERSPEHRQAQAPQIEEHAAPTRAPASRPAPPPTVCAIAREVARANAYAYSPRQARRLLPGVEPPAPAAPAPGLLCRRPPAE